MAVVRTFAILARGELWQQLRPGGVDARLPVPHFNVINGGAHAPNPLDFAAKEFTEAGDDVQLIFDGAGTQWLGLLSDPEHKAHRLFEHVRDVVSGACGYCSRAFDAEEGVHHAHIKLLEE